MNIILLWLLWAGRKIAQIGQTKPAGVSRSCAVAQREVKFVQNTRHKKKRKFVKSQISSLGLSFF